MLNSALSFRHTKGHALLVVDMISDYEFEDGEKLYPNTLNILEPLAGLKASLRLRGVPTIYVNDELGEGSNHLFDNLETLRSRSDKARTILDRLAPDAIDHWIVKPQRSGFYATGLGNLLHSLSISSVIVAGVTTDICVLFTAHDAYMRGYSVWIPANCSAAAENSHHEEALRFLARVAEADTRPVDWGLTDERISISEAGSMQGYGHLNGVLPAPLESQ
jgi:nicotinamidase-related amidase